MSVKFSNAQIAAIRSAGTEKGSNLILPLSFLEEHAPERVRTSEVDRTAKFTTVLGAFGPDDSGRVVLPIVALVESGLPAASICTPAYWSGIGDGSCMAFDAGYKSKQVTTVVGGVVSMTVVLAPLTDDDRAKHAKSLTKADAKAAADKAAREAAKVQASGAGTEGAPVQDDAGASA